MRKIACSTLMLTSLFLLAACNPSSPADEPAADTIFESSSAPAPATTAAEAAAAAVAASASAAAAEDVLPVGACGDQSGVPADERVANTLRWSTASEQDNFGYDVYRGDSEEGDFTRLTEQPIPGAGTSDLSHQYEYHDDSIDPCERYWYYVEAISTSGEREKFTPTFQSKAKRRAATDDADTPAADASND